MSGRNSIESSEPVAGCWEAPHSNKGARYKPKKGEV